MKSILASEEMLIFVTVFSFILGRKVFEKVAFTLFNPIIISSVIIFTYLKLAHISIRHYMDSVQVLTGLLIPGTMMLGLITYKHRALLVKNFLVIVFALFLGASFSIAANFYLAKAFGLSNVMLKSFLFKSSSSTFATALASLIGGNLSLAVMGSVLTGICGSFFVSSYMFNLFGIKDPINQGITTGMSSHLIGVARLNNLNNQGAEESPQVGFGAIMVGLTGLFFAILGLVVYRLLLKA